MQFLITEDGSHTIFLPEFNETYHSTHGAIQESKYVFIERGLGYFIRQNHSDHIKVFEVGFGTGLNTLIAALYSKNQQREIRYQSIEAFPLEASIIDNLNYSTLLQDGSAGECFNKIHSCTWDEWNEITSEFRLKKIDKRIQDVELEKCDIVFFDAFAPSKQPEMWEKEILLKIHGAMSFQGVFVTYCAKGQLKRDLKEIGFKVETLTGPPGKKEMIRAIKI